MILNNNNWPHNSGVVTKNRRHDSGVGPKDKISCSGLGGLGISVKVKKILLIQPTRTKRSDVPVISISIIS